MTSPLSRLPDAVQRCGCYIDPIKVQRDASVLLGNYDGLRALCVPKPSALPWSASLVLQISGVIKAESTDQNGRASGGCVPTAHMAKIVFHPHHPNTPPVFFMQEVHASHSSFSFGSRPNSSSTTAISSSPVVWSSFPKESYSSGDLALDVATIIRKGRPAAGSGSGSSSSNASTDDSVHTEDSTVSLTSATAHGQGQLGGGSISPRLQGASSSAGTSKDHASMTHGTQSVAQKHLRMLAAEVSKLRKETADLQSKVEKKRGRLAGAIAQVKEDMRLFEADSSKSLRELADEKDLLEKMIREKGEALQSGVYDARSSKTDNSAAFASSDDEQDLTSDDGAGSTTGVHDLQELRHFLLDEDGFVRHVKELIVACSKASVKSLSGSNQLPLDPRRVYELSNEELDRIQSEAQRLRPSNGVQREVVRLVVENVRLMRVANDYAEGILRAPLSKLEDPSARSEEPGAGSSGGRIPSKGSIFGQSKACSTGMFRMCSPF